MADFGIIAKHPATADSRPHVFSFATARTTPGDLLLEVRNGPDVGDRVFSIDRDGNMVAGGAERVLALLPGREAVRLGNFVIEWNADFDTLDVLYEPE